MIPSVSIGLVALAIIVVVVVGTLVLLGLLLKPGRRRRW